MHALSYKRGKTRHSFINDCSPNNLLRLKSSRTPTARPDTPGRVNRGARVENSLGCIACCMKEERRVRYSSVQLTVCRDKDMREGSHLERLQRKKKKTQPRSKSRYQKKESSNPPPKRVLPPETRVKSALLLSNYKSHTSRQLLYKAEQMFLD